MEHRIFGTAVAAVYGHHSALTVLAEKASAGKQMFTGTDEAGADSLESAATAFDPNPRGVDGYVVFRIPPPLPEATGKRTVKVDWAALRPKIPPKKRKKSEE